eukprot:6397457-Prymnesium_polylepis.1
MHPAHAERLAAERAAAEARWREQARLQQEAREVAEQRARAERERQLLLRAIDDRIADQNIAGADRWLLAVCLASACSPCCHGTLGSY